MTLCLRFHEHVQETPKLRDSLLLASDGCSCMCSRLHEHVRDCIFARPAKFEHATLDLYGLTFATRHIGLLHVITPNFAIKTQMNDFPWVLGMRKRSYREPERLWLR
jgi:hypothetical protein